MKNNKPIKKITKESVMFSQGCNQCDQEITGSTEEMLFWNMSVHKMAKHKKVKAE
jgi:hypothetical protein